MRMGILKNPYVEWHSQEYFCGGHNKEYISYLYLSIYIYILCGGIAKNPYVDGHTKISLCGELFCGAIIKNTI